MSGSHGVQKRKFKKSYYSNNFKTKKNVLSPGCKGFLITCNAQEQYAVREAYNILNEYADKIYGEQIESEQDTAGSAKEKKDIEDDLEEELRGLRQSETTKFRFNQKSTGVKNVIFVNANVGDPCKIALSLMENVKSTKKQSSRFLLRLVPVLSVCKPFLENLKESVSEVLVDFLANHHSYADEERHVTYAVQYHARNNNRALAKEEVYSAVIDVVNSKRIAWKVGLDNPDLTVSVDVLGTMCCIGVLPDYVGFKKYNLQELAKDDPKKDETNDETGEMKENKTEKCAEGSSVDDSETAEEQTEDK